MVDSQPRTQDSQSPQLPPDLLKPQGDTTLKVDAAETANIESVEEPQDLETETLVLVNRLLKSTIGIVEALEEPIKFLVRSHVEGYRRASESPRTLAACYLKEALDLETSSDEEEDPAKTKVKAQAYRAAYREMLALEEPQPQITQMPRRRYIVHGRYLVRRKRA